MVRARAPARGGAECRVGICSSPRWRSGSDYFSNAERGGSMRGRIVLATAGLLTIWTTAPAPTQNAQPVPKKRNWQGVPAQVNEIQRELINPSAKDQKEAAQALGKIGAAVRSSVMSLDAELRTHHDPLVRRACAVALGEIGPSAHYAVGGL